MDNQNKAGDMIFKAGDGSLSGKGGDLHIGPGNYRAGDVVQTISYSEIVNSLIRNINISNLPEAQKKSLIEKLQIGIGTIANIATLTQLIFSAFCK